MNPRFKNTIALLLSVAILVSSNGIVLAAHTCFSKAETKVSLFKATGCCSTEKLNDLNEHHADGCHDSIGPKKCCQLSLSFHKVDVSSTVLKLNNFHHQLPSSAFSFFSFRGSEKSSRAFFHNKLPPSNSGRILLTKISLLQI